MIQDVWHQLQARKMRDWSIIKLYILCFVFIDEKYVIAVFSSKGRFHDKKKIFIIFVLHLTQNG